MPSKRPIKLPSRYLSDMFNVLCVIALNERVNTAVIEETLNMPAASIFRHVRRLRSNFKLEIDYIRTKGEVGKAGYYEIKDWGILDDKKFFKLMLDD